MKQINEYTATNIHTGEVLKGRADIIAKRLNVHRQNIYSAKCLNVLICNTWRVTAETIELNLSEEEEKERPITRDLLDEWDKARLRIKRAPRKKVRFTNRISSSGMMFTRL